MGKSRASGRNAGNVASNAAAEAECRARFEKLFAERYAHRFEFLGGRTSSKGKARLRCMVCGCEFEKFGSFAQMDLNIYCPRCHAHRDDDVMAPHDGRLAETAAGMYAAGVDMCGIASATGISVRYIAAILRERGVDIDANRRNRLQHERHEALRAVLTDFKAIRGELGGCRADRLLKGAQRRAERDGKGFGKAERFVEDFAPSWAECKHCGRRYLFFPSLKKFGRKSANAYCSKACSRRANKRSSSIGHRLRAHGGADKPRDSIKLDEVIERDNGICYICGCRTSKDDHYYSRGWFACGDRYPTIDHVVPLAKGGMHTWGNVRLACHRCNRLKRDSVA